MKKIIALVLSMVLIISMFAACNSDQPDVGENEATKNTTGNTAPKDETYNYNVEYFVPTREVCSEEAPIYNFPILNFNDEFWINVPFTVYPEDGVVFDGFEEASSYSMTWDQVKKLSIGQISKLVIKDDKTIVLRFQMLAKDKNKTVEDVVADGEWGVLGTLGTEKQINAFFPKKANSVEEMIVENYGHPTTVRVKGNGFDLQYDLGDRTVTLTVSDNVKIDDGELPYTIKIKLRENKN